MKLTPHHTALSVASLEDSLAFYRALGFGEVHRYRDQDKTNVHLRLDDYYLEVFAYHENNALPKLTLDYAGGLRQRGVKHIAFSVVDIDSALEHLMKVGLAPKGTKIMDQLDDVRFFFIQDPDGMWVEIITDNRY